MNRDTADELLDKLQSIIEFVDAKQTRINEEIEKIKKLQQRINVHSRKISDLENAMADELDKLFPNWREIIKQSQETQP